MKVLLPIVVLLCVLVFVLGLTWPRKSRSVQFRVAKKSRKLERKLRRKDGKLPDWSAKSLEMAREATNKSARAGRKLRGEE